MSVDLETSAIQCNYCGEPFESEEDEGRVIFIVPVECAKGKFCSEACRARAAYDQSDPDVQRAMRRLYLGSILVADNVRAVEQYLEGWEGEEALDVPIMTDVIVILSPDGGTIGNEGVEDDCMAKLMPPSAGKAIWDGLYKARILARQDISRAERTLTLGTHLSPEYWEKQIADAKEQAAKIDAALVALEGLRVVVE